jgi:acetyl-CoA carboxylase biotin carboxyl carrier protein
MNLDQLRQILALVREHDLSELEIEHEGFRLRVRKRSAQREHERPPASESPAPAAPAATPAPQHAVASDAPGGADSGVAVVKSPMVGTFYRAAEPEAAPFVEVGTIVRKGQVLCIIEAMKLMNEIDSEHEGEVVSVYAENGQPVQYGERLFAIRTG